MAALKREFPQARVLEVSCQTGEGLGDWFELLLSGELEGRPSMEVDYDVYADGEAMLGWLNARASFTADPAMDANQFMIELTERLKKQLAVHSAEIAHCKMSVESGEPAEFASMSLTSSHDKAAATWRCEKPLSAGLLTLNLRAEADTGLAAQRGDDGAVYLSRSVNRCAGDRGVQAGAADADASAGGDGGVIQAARSAAGRRWHAGGLGAAFGRNQIDDG